MSFMLTTEQYRNRTKTVTRRDGWLFAKVGMQTMGCEKCQGLGKGGKIVRMHANEFVDVRRERLCDITQDDVVREGFPDMTPAEFVVMYCKHNGGPPDKIVTRIEFKHLEE